MCRRVEGAQELKLLSQAAVGAVLEDPDARNERDHRNYRDDLVDQVLLANRP